MSEVYPYNDLLNGSNIIEWMLIMNDWSDGLLFSGFILGICLLVFAVMRYKNIEIDDALIGSGMLGFFISGISWLIQFNGIRMIPTSIPIILLIVAGVGIILKIARNTFQ